MPTHRHVAAEQVDRLEVALDRAWGEVRGAQVPPEAGRIGGQAVGCDTWRRGCGLGQGHQGASGCGCKPPDDSLWRPRAEAVSALVALFERRPRARSSADRASDFGSEGRGFESLRARHRHHLRHGRDGAVPFRRGCELHLLPRCGRGCRTCIMPISLPARDDG